MIYSMNIYYKHQRSGLILNHFSSEDHETDFIPARRFTPIDLWSMYIKSGGWGSHIYGRNELELSEPPP
jgi:hypothetical protein